MKKRILLSIMTIIAGCCVWGAVSWVKYETSRVTLISGGITYELVEKWVWFESFGTLGDSARFPTAVEIFPDVAQTVADAKLIPAHDEMKFQNVSIFGVTTKADQEFTLYDNQYNRLDISHFAELQDLDSGQYYIVVSAIRGFPFNRTGYEYIGKILLP